MKNLINFEQMEWSHPHEGVRSKEIEHHGRKMRLLEFSDGFAEHGWCLKGHIGYILEGKVTVNFSGEIREFSKGDGIWIEEGTEHKHKASVEPGGRALLILFENA
jgi:hypothetical protein